MDKKIEEIINELIKLDSEFAKHQSDLKILLAKIISAKPNPVIDQNFVTNLKNTLMANLEQNPIKPKIQINFMKRLIFATTSLVVVLLAVVVGLKYFNLKQGGVFQLSSKVNITRAEANAFGALDQVSSSGGKGGGGTGTEATDSTKSAAPTALGLGGGGGGVSSDIYVPTNYKYVYKGDPLTPTAAQLDVLKKDNVNYTGSMDLTPFGLGLVNLNSFSNSKVQSISFNQDQGYNIYVDLTSGMIGISGFYEPIPYAADNAKIACPINGCPQPKPIDPKDVPSDEELVSIANNFISEHGISTSAYGDPEVVKEQIYYILNKSAPAYVPEYKTVLFPLKINDQLVYDEGGAKTGLMIGISVRSKKVNSVSNLTTQNYQASSYDAETDISRILKIAEAGGMYSYTDPNAKKTVEIDLGTPTTELVQMWDYQNNQSTTLLVPSLIFPVIQQPTDGSFYRQSVVIPLIKNILDKNNNSGGPVQIMPLEDNGNTGSGSSGAVEPMLRTSTN